jgi:hypothetical protein
MRLFMFYVGGSCGSSNVELHDVRFAVGETAEDCYPDLREQWWGDPDSLHLDCWGELTHADGHAVTVGPQASDPAGDRLFFVNLGGYDPGEFTEQHRNSLVVAPDARTAAKRALVHVQSWSEPHRDNVLDVDNAVDVTAQLGAAGVGLTLAPAAAEQPFTFSCRYTPIA